jgi:hypothetical protein
MAGKWTDVFSYVACAVRRDSMFYLSLISDETAKLRVPDAQFVMWNQGDWLDGGARDWNLAGLAVAKQPLEQMIAVGEWGDVLCAGSGDVHDEHVTSGQRDPAAKGPKDRGPLRGVRRIGSRIYVVGMDRQAYRREGSSRWQSFGPPGWRELGRPAPKVSEVTGFEAVDGFSESDVYAVGYHGEIWHCDGRKWRQLPSPTNLVLTDVCCAGDGTVYACGREGLLLKGRDQTWEVIDPPGTPQDLWSLAWFDGRLYLSTFYALYTLNKNALEPVDTGAEQAKTFHRLSADDGVLLSAGAKDVLVFDGKAWTRID